DVALPAGDPRVLDDLAASYRWLAERLLAGLAAAGARGLRAVPPAEVRAAPARLLGGRRGVRDRRRVGAQARRPRAAAAARRRALPGRGLPRGVARAARRPPAARAARARRAARPPAAGRHLERARAGVRGRAARRAGAGSLECPAHEHARLAHARLSR